MKARLYLQPCFFSCARVYESLTQIPLFFRAHTDPTDPTGFARLMLNLTDALRNLASSGSHRFHSQKCTPGGKSHGGFTPALEKKTPILSI